MLDDPLVEAFVAAAEQCQLALLRQLPGQGVVQAAPGGRERNHPPPRRCLAVASLHRRLHHVDADHHSGAAPIGRVVDLAPAERRPLAEVHELDLRASVADVALLREPVEPVREEREDVDLHQKPRNSRSTSMSLRSRSIRLTASPITGTTRASSPTSSNVHAGASRTRSTRPSPGTSQPIRSATPYSSSSSSSSI